MIRPHRRALSRPRSTPTKTRPAETRRPAPQPTAGEGPVGPIGLDDPRQPHHVCARLLACLRALQLPCTDPAWEEAALHRSGDAAATRRALQDVEDEFSKAVGWWGEPAAEAEARHLFRAADLWARRVEAAALAQPATEAERHRAGGFEDVLGDLVAEGGRVAADFRDLAERHLGQRSGRRPKGRPSSEAPAALVAGLPHDDERQPFRLLEGVREACRELCITRTRGAWDAAQGRLVNLAAKSLCKLRDPAGQDAFAAGARHVRGGLTLGEVLELYAAADRYLFRFLSEHLPNPFRAATPDELEARQYAASDRLEDGRPLAERFRLVADQVEADRRTAAVVGTPSGPTAAATSDPEPGPSGWSRVLSRSAWAARLGQGRKAFRRDLEAGKFRHKELSASRIMIALDDLPTAVREKL